MTTNKEHNPDNLTPAQYGAAEGWRLLDVDEVGQQFAHTNSFAGAYWYKNQWWLLNCAGDNKETTYRTQHTSAELRKARGLPEETQRIPFDLKLWQSGGFDVVTRSGNHLKSLYTQPSISLEGSVVIGQTNSLYACYWNEYGRVNSQNESDEDDLFLVPKPQPKGGDEPCSQELTQTVISNASPEGPIPSGSEAGHCSECGLVEEHASWCSLRLKPHPLTASMEKFALADEVEGAMSAELKQKSHDLIRYANSQPAIINLLYDLDLMPEQLRDLSRQWFHMLMIIESFQLLCLANVEMAGKLEEIKKLAERHVMQKLVPETAAEILSIINPTERKA